MQSDASMSLKVVVDARGYVKGVQIGDSWGKTFYAIEGLEHIVDLFNNPKEPTALQFVTGGADIAANAWSTLYTVPDGWALKVIGGTFGVGPSTNAVADDNMYGFFICAIPDVNNLIYLGFADYYYKGQSGAPAYVAFKGPEVWLPAGTQIMAWNGSNRSVTAATFHGVIRHV